MAQRLDIDLERIVPEIPAMLRSQGVPARVIPSDRVLQLAREAQALFRELAAPLGKLHELQPDEFREVYHGEGGNAERTPLAEIYPGATALALFAVTIGEPVCEEISRLFEANDPALGAMLDAAASEAADRAAEQAESIYREMLRAAGRLDDSMGALRYSPGYCGWHITGQRRLFASLTPEETGIRLGDSCLMSPLKSVSGVIVAGPRPIFEFDNDYSFCDACDTWSCRDRIEAVRSQ